MLQISSLNFLSIFAASKRLNSSKIFENFVNARSVEAAITNLNNYHRANLLKIWNSCLRTKLYAEISTVFQWTQPDVQTTLTLARNLKIIFRTENTGLLFGCFTLIQWFFRRTVALNINWFFRHLVALFVT